MCHSSQLLKYYDSKLKVYSAEKSFYLVSKSLQKADIVLGNLETTIPSRITDYSGYPRFGAPPALIKSLKTSGFHIISTANNHSADKGSDGIDHTLDVIMAEDLIPIGTYRSLEDYKERRNFSIEKNQIVLAVYNYTYSTNGIRVPKNKIVRLLDEKTVLEDLNFAKQQRIDFILIWFHFGTEYRSEPDASQYKWVKFALENGADVVVGGHPHVVQRVEKSQSVDSKGELRDQLTAFSLGNFLSAQNRPATDGGMMLSFDLSISGNGLKKIEHINTEAVWVDPKQFQIIPIKNYLDNKGEIYLSPDSEKKMNQYYKYFLKAMKDNKL